MPVDFSIKSNLGKVQRNLTLFATRQLPYATALALTELAKDVQAAEQKNMQAVLDRPTPFTLRSVGVRPARKTDHVATVFVKDIAAAYLLPYQFGGLNKLNSRALLKPVDATLNQYGNLPRNFTRRMSRRKDVFVGIVKTAAGEVNGIWQRVEKNGKKGRGLQLLVKFEDAHAVKQNLRWFDVAGRVIARRTNFQLGRAIGRAIASAR
jgi:hypothetical protein